MYQTLAPSPLVGKYTIGAVMARLDEAGVTMVPMTRLVAVEPGTLTVAHCFSGRTLDDRRRRLGRAGLRIRPRR